MRPDPQHAAPLVPAATSENPLIAPFPLPSHYACFKLHVVVRRARHLKAHDLNGKNDPYVKLRLGQQMEETRVQIKTNSPEWNEHFVFGVSSVEAQQLHVTMYDFDKFKHDDLIGTCHIGLSHLPVEEVGELACHPGQLAAGIMEYPGKAGDGHHGHGDDLSYTGGLGCVASTGTRNGHSMHGGEVDSLDETRSTATALTESVASSAWPVPSGGSLRGMESEQDDLDPKDWDRSPNVDESLSMHGAAGDRRRTRAGSDVSGVSGFSSSWRRTSMSSAKNIVPWSKKVRALFLHPLFAPT